MCIHVSFPLLQELTTYSFSTVHSSKVYVYLHYTHPTNAVTCVTATL